MDQQFLKNIIEAVLMSSDGPLSVTDLLNVFEVSSRPEKAMVEACLDQLMHEYEERGVELKLFASGYGFQTRTQYSPWIARLLNDKPVKYSGALLETLAIIAYRQPVTRADIEEIRGVATNSAIIKTLTERNWIRVAGYRDVPGKPAVYVTTKTFLDYFNLSSLNDLPILQQSVLTDD